MGSGRAALLPEAYEWLCWERCPGLPAMGSDEVWRMAEAEWSCRAEGTASRGNGPRGASLAGEGCASAAGRAATGLWDLGPADRGLSRHLDFTSLFKKNQKT